MKRALLALVGCIAMLGSAGAAEQPVELESSLRQDPTGEGTFHRKGLLREQAAAVRNIPAATPAPSPEPKRNLWQSFCRLFQSTSQP